MSFNAHHYGAGVEIATTGVGVNGRAVGVSIGAAVDMIVGVGDAVAPDAALGIAAGMAKKPKASRITTMM